MLQVENLNQFYGSSHTLRDVSFSVPTGAVTPLLGRNGVGKTTLLKCIMGVLPSKSGRIVMELELIVLDAILAAVQRISTHHQFINTPDRKVAADMDPPF